MSMMSFLCCCVKVLETGKTPYGCSSSVHKSLHDVMVSPKFSLPRNCKTSGKVSKKLDVLPFVSNQHPTDKTFVAGLAGLAIIVHQRPNVLDREQS